ncbi:MAG: hypothetical protein IJH20_02445 [Bacilli bacterium]|nr:hypothetical protein [Bacilli bacterium]
MNYSTISNIETVKKYNDLVIQYRKRNFKNIEEKIIDGLYVSDAFVFPRYWEKIDDINVRIAYLEKSLKQDIPIDELEDYRDFKYDRLMERVDELKKEYNKKKK